MPSTRGTPLADLARIRRQHDPLSSYRLQFSARFRFEDATALVSYLDELGITDCYTSPLLKSVTGSEHGYDISDHASLNPALGSEDEFVTLAASLTARGMGLILDFVPNHMGLDERSNRWWRDVLEHGPDSPFAAYFDIDWTASDDHPRGRVLLPILEDGYGDVLHRGEIRLDENAGVPVISYYDRQLPIAPGTLDGLVDPGTAPQALNGDAGDAASWDRLHALLERQWYRLAHWKTSFDEINYRRFFDVNQLGGIRMELPDVFAATHQKVFELIALAHITGLRLDHPDGLLDPAAYFEALHEAIEAIASEPGAQTATPFHVVAEKILAHGERLPASWPIAGTTGYGFLNDLNGLFVASGNEKAMRRVYAGATGRRESFAEVSYRSRRLVARSSMASELSMLTHALKRLAETDRRTRDFTATALSRAIAEMVACMPVYRTYISESGFSASDRQTVDVAIDRARRCNPVMAPAVFMFLRQVLLADGAENPTSLHAKRQFAMKFQQFSAPIQAKGIEDTAFYRYNALVSLNEVGGDPACFGTPVDTFHAGNAVRLEQWPREMTTTATHDTKRGEDARARLNVLSEIPLEWRRAVMQWRRINAIRRTAVDREWAPDTNDEYLLYQTLTGSWPAEALDAPIPREAPGDFVGRLKAFMLKAIREAKTHTSWLNQNHAYEDAVAVFVETTLRGSTAERFLKSFVPFAREVARAGMVNSLAQVVLKVASPGVPDFYQGTELWQFDFADPDNRRPVDFASRVEMLAAMRPWVDRADPTHTPVAGDGGQAPFVTELADTWPDGRIKMFVTAAALRLRRAWAPVFVEGAYLPLGADGPGRDHIVACARQLGDRAAVAVVPRFSTTLRRTVDERRLGETWANTVVVLPTMLATGRLRNVITNEQYEVSDGTLDARALFRRCPVALLVTSACAHVQAKRPC